MSSTKDTLPAQEKAQQLFQSAWAHLQQNKSSEADELFLQAYELDPKNIDVLNLLGIRCYQKQDFVNALFFLNSANLVAPNSPHTLSNLGLVHNSLSQFLEALNYCDRSIEIDSTIPEAHNNRANSLKGLHRDAEAILAYDKAISLRPKYAEALSNKGILFLEAGKFHEAITLFEEAINANPNLAEAFNSMGNALTELGLYEKAFANFEQALQIRSNYLDACINFGNSLKKAKQYESAIQCYEYALKISPDNSKIFYLLGEVYYAKSDSVSAKINYAKSLSLDPSNLEARYALTIAQIQKIYKNLEELSNSRKSFIKNLDSLEKFRSKESSLKIISKAIGRHPFYLAYQEENNFSPLSRFGKLCTQEAQKIQRSLVTSGGAPKADKKIRIGVVSHFFYDHPVWHAITKGWIRQLNSNQFEILVFNTGGKEDSETKLAKLRASKYFSCSKNVVKVAQEVLEQNLDAVLFPEIGMDATTKALACLRLAPLQIASWGHPETTGLPNIDFFLSAELLESENAQNYYSEKLILLPNLGTYFEFQQIESSRFNFQRYGLNENLPILICAGSPSKYLPTYDHIFVEIAQRIGQVQFIFFDFDQNLGAVLEERLRQVFLNSHLDPERHIFFIPFQKRETFYGLLKEAKLYLDTIGFSGFNTAMQAILCDLPIITLEGHSLRSRLASGILNKLGLSELSCKTKAGYVDLATEIIQNPHKLESHKAMIRSNKNRLFNDQSPITSLENFLIKNVKK